MLTDRQMIALNLLETMIDEPSTIAFMAKDNRLAKSIIGDALTVADTFLEMSNPEPDLVTGKLQANNQKLQGLVSEILSNASQVEISQGIIAWVDGEPVYEEGIQ